MVLGNNVEGVGMFLRPRLNRVIVLNVQHEGLVMRSNFVLDSQSHSR